MPSPVAINTTGVAAFRRDLRRMEPLLDRGLHEAIKDAADKVTVTAGAYAPRRSGDLAHSIKPYVRGATASIRSELPYAGVVHWGGTIQPRGTAITFRRSEFITRAVRDHQDEIVEDIADAVDVAARVAGWH
jgi:phage gpG-like protein